MAAVTGPHHQCRKQYWSCESISHSLRVCWINHWPVLAQNRPWDAN